MTANGYGIKEVDLSKKATLNKSAGFVASEKCVASSKGLLLLGQGSVSCFDILVFCPLGSRNRMLFVEGGFHNPWIEFISPPWIIRALRGCQNAGFANNEGFGLVAHTVFLEGMYCVEIGIDIDMELPPGLSLPSLPNNPRCG